MSKNEVIKRLKDHLAYCKSHHGRITRNDKFYCIHYIMDFMMINFNEAKNIYECEVI